MMHVRARRIQLVVHACSGCIPLVLWTRSAAPKSTPHARLRLSAHFSKLRGHALVSGPAHLASWGHALISGSAHLSQVRPRPHFRSTAPSEGAHWYPVARAQWHLV